MADHEAFEQRQLSVKEMTAPGHDGNRQYLRARPVHDSRQRHRVIGFAVHHQGPVMGFGRDRRHGETAGRRSHQHRLFHPALVPEPCQHMAGDEGPE